MFDGAHERSASIPHHASSRPIAPPIPATSIFSSNRSRMIRKRLAPSATRIPISFCRFRPRANARLPTLAHAIRRTNPTAPSNTSSAGRTSLTVAACSGTTLRPIPSSTSGYCFARRAQLCSVRSEPGEARLRLQLCQERGAVHHTVVTLFVA